VIDGRGEKYQGYGLENDPGRDLEIKKVNETSDIERG